MLKSNFPTSIEKMISGEKICLEGLERLIDRNYLHDTGIHVRVKNIIVGNSKLAPPVILIFPVVAV